MKTKVFEWVTQIVSGSWEFFELKKKIRKEPSQIAKGEKVRSENR